MITVEQLRNTARFHGSSRSDQAILEIADRLEQLEREVETLKNILELKNEPTRN
jgi:hypothetical protein